MGVQLVFAPGRRYGLSVAGWSGPILESKGMHVIFQKKGKKGQNIWKFGQKCIKFDNILKKRQVIACDYCTQ